MELTVKNLKPHVSVVQTTDSWLIHEYRPMDYPKSSTPMVDEVAWLLFLREELYEGIHVRSATSQVI